MMKQKTLDLCRPACKDFQEAEKKNAKNRVIKANTYMQIYLSLQTLLLEKSQNHTYCIWNNGTSQFWRENRFTLHIPFCMDSIFNIYSYPFYFQCLILKLKHTKMSYVTQITRG